MKGKKSQMKMMETIAILIIFFILLALGFGFYLKMSHSSSKEESEKNADLMIIQVTQRASFLPELQCSDNNVITDNCFDMVKLDGLGTKGLDKNEYFPLFGYSVIKIEYLYPEPKPTTYVWTIYDNKMDGEPQLTTMLVPVSIYNPVEKKYAIGNLTVQYYYD